MKFKVTTDFGKFDRKPTGREIADVSKNLKSITEVDFLGLLHLTTNLGSSFSPALYDHFEGFDREGSYSTTVTNNTANSDNWVEQQLFVLDFDEGVTVDETIDKCYRNEIYPNVIYRTFSDADAKEDKFRLIIGLDKPVGDREIRDRIQDSLLQVFEHADSNCRDAGRFFFGGIEGEVFTPHLNSLQAIYEFSQGVERVRTGRARNVLSKDPIKDSRKKYSNSEKLKEFQKRCDNFSNNKVDNWIGKLRDRVRVFEKFDDGFVLSYNEFYGLLTNLFYIKGGETYVFNKIEEVNSQKGANYNDNKIATAKNYRKYKRRGHYPQDLEDFSKYKEDHKYKNLLSALRYKKGEVNVLNKPSFISLERAESKLEEEFEKMLNADDNKIYLFKLPPAIGKTELLTNLKNVCIAFPTHFLKEEISRDRMQVEHECTDAIPSFEDENLDYLLNKYYDLGLIGKANSLLQEVAEDGIWMGEYSLDDQETAQNYLNRRERQCANHEQTVLTTHVRALHSNFTHDLIAFDEDPQNYLLKKGQVDLRDLTTVKEEMVEVVEEGKSNIEQFESVIDDLRSLEANNIQPFTNRDIRFKFYNPHNLNQCFSNVAELLESDYVVKSRKNNNKISYIKKYDLPKNKKVCIMSASASVEMYKKLYGNRLEVIDIENVDRTGTITQHTTHTFSKSSIENHGIDYINQMKSKDRPCITHKAFRKAIKNAREDIYFGKCVGSNQLEGRDIDVVGTYHMPENIYKLIGYVMGIYDSEDKLQNREVEFDGMEFQFYTFSSKPMQKLHMSMIKGQLLQAIGRARALREDVKVDLYSNLPLAIADEYRY